MYSDRIKVLFIGGAGRSGSTILDCLLGQIDGLFSVGELTNIWFRSFVNNELCGCGFPFEDCLFWREVVQDAYPVPCNLDISAVVACKRDLEQRLQLPLLLSGKGPWPFRRNLNNYTHNLSLLYKSIQRVSGAEVIVDSSKNPYHGLVLQLTPRLDLYVLHLIRDSRAVAHSWQRQKARPDVHGEQALMPQLGASASSLVWLRQNALMEVMRSATTRYMTLRYEDLAASPISSLRKVTHWLGRHEASFPESRGRRVQLAANHTVSGNPARFQHGSVEICVDQEWKSKLCSSDKAVVTALTWPLLLKYGYLFRRQEACVRPDSVFQA